MSAGILQSHEVQKVKDKLQELQRKHELETFYYLPLITAKKQGKGVLTQTCQLKMLKN